MNNCNKCNKETTNVKYCSRSCANSVNNSKFKKRKLKNKCKLCSTKIYSDVVYCTNCWKTKKIGCDITLKESINNRLHKSSAFALIRARARKIAKDNNMNICEFCNYTKHVEICHIKPISTFPDNTKISIINSITNLKALCPNCHWEFDHNL